MSVWDRVGHFASDIALSAYFSLEGLLNSNDVTEGLYRRWNNLIRPNISQYSAEQLVDVIFQDLFEVPAGVKNVSDVKKVRNIAVSIGGSFTPYDHGVSPIKLKDIVLRRILSFAEQHPDYTFTAKPYTYDRYHSGRRRIYQSLGFTWDAEEDIGYISANDLLEKHKKTWERLKLQNVATPDPNDRDTFFARHDIFNSTLYRLGKHLQAAIDFITPRVTALINEGTNFFNTIFGRQQSTQSVSLQNRQPPSKQKSSSFGHLIKDSLQRITNVISHHGFTNLVEQFKRLVQSGLAFLQRVFNKLGFGSSPSVSHPPKGSKVNSYTPVKGDTHSEQAVEVLNLILSLDPRVSHEKFDNYQGSSGHLERVLEVDHKTGETKLVKLVHKVFKPWSLEAESRADFDNYVSQNQLDPKKQAAKSLDTYMHEALHLLQVLRTEAISPSSAAEASPLPLIQGFGEAESFALLPYLSESDQGKQGLYKMLLTGYEADVFSVEMEPLLLKEHGDEFLPFLRVFASTSPDQRMQLFDPTSALYKKHQQQLTFVQRLHEAKQKYGSPEWIGLNKALVSSLSFYRGLNTNLFPVAGGSPTEQGRSELQLRHDKVKQSTTQAFQTFIGSTQGTLYLDSLMKDVFGAEYSEAKKSVTGDSVSERNLSKVRMLYTIGEKLLQVYDMSVSPQVKSDTELFRRYAAYSTLTSPFHHALGYALSDTVSPDKLVKVLGLLSDVDSFRKANGDLSTFVLKAQQKVKQFSRYYKASDTISKKEGVVDTGAAFSYIVTASQQKSTTIKPSSTPLHSATSSTSTRLTLDNRQLLLSEEDSEQNVYILPKIVSSSAPPPDDGDDSSGDKGRFNSGDKGRFNHTSIFRHIQRVLEPIKQGLSNFKQRLSNLARILSGVRAYFNPTNLR
jgi:hypothetical protein